MVRDERIPGPASAPAAGPRPPPRLRCPSFPSPSSGYCRPSSSSSWRRSPWKRLSTTPSSSAASLCLRSLHAIGKQLWPNRNSRNESNGGGALSSLYGGRRAGSPGDFCREPGREDLPEPARARQGGCQRRVPSSPGGESGGRSCCGADNALAKAAARQCGGPLEFGLDSAASASNAARAAARSSAFRVFSALSFSAHHAEMGWGGQHPVMRGSWFDTVPASTVRFNENRTRHGQQLDPERPSP